MSNHIFAPVGALEDALNNAVYERKHEIHGMIASMMAGEHVYIGGPPGSGKSYMGRMMQSLIGGAIGFSNTFHAFSTPDEVAGPFDPSMILSGRMRRKTDGMLPRSHFARLEEIFKSGAGCLGILTDILVDGVILQEGQEEKCDLIQALATSNELPQDDSLAYLWDRFALRYWVDYLKSRESRLKALTLRKGHGSLKPIVSLDDLIEMRLIIKRTPIDSALSETLLNVQEALFQEGYTLSDRRLGRLQEVCHADMLVFNKSPADAALIVSAGAWMQIDQRDAVKRIVAKAANPHLGRVIELHDAAREKYDEGKLAYNAYWQLVKDQPSRQVSINAESLQRIQACNQVVKESCGKVREALSLVGQHAKDASDECAKWANELQGHIVEVVQNRRRLDSRSAELDANGFTAAERERMARS